MASRIEKEVDRSDDAKAVNTYAMNLMVIECLSCEAINLLDEDLITQNFTSITAVCTKEATKVGALDEHGGARTVLCANACLTCTSCGKELCLGCGIPLLPSTERDGVHPGDFSLTWHCEAARLALIWLLLCGYDAQVKHNKPLLSTPAPGSRKRTYGQNSGIGYSMNDSYGPASATVADSIRIDPDDTLTARVMAMVTSLLPSLNRVVPDGFDEMPPDVLCPILLQSSILDRAAELLRNDSLEDVTKRAGLYESTLAFVTALTTHYATAQHTVYDARAVNQVGHDLLKVSLGQPTMLTGEKQECAQSLAICFANLNIQAMTLVGSATTKLDIFESEEGQRMLWLCRNICDLGDLLKVHASLHTADKASNGLEPDEDAWQKDLSLLDVQDEDILKGHTFASSACAANGGATGRMRALIKDINSLKTSLPPGIFVRHGASRLDTMKILIRGPRDTPYENGLFEFDLFCGPNYPNEPPQMSFKTTGRGTVRFNPNLYADGKVCLSLLGTWQGEKWLPGQSTLLQVFVSLQAMVFCDEPYCNEPSYEGSRGTSASKKYSQNLYGATVRHAMLEWLQDEKLEMPLNGSSMFPLGTGSRGRTLQGTTGSEISIWSAIVKKHFDANGMQIEKTIARWVGEVRLLKANATGVGLEGDLAYHMPPARMLTEPGKLSKSAAAEGTKDRLIARLEAALRDLIYVNGEL